MTDQQLIPEAILDSKNDDKTEIEREELLLIRCGESATESKLFGCLGNSHKWINLGSVNFETLQLRGEALGPFLGFANSSMVFEIGCKERYRESHDDVVLIPLHDGASKKIRTGCGNCSSIDNLEGNECPHVYFTAWNELFCLSAKVKINYKPGTIWTLYDSDSDDYGDDERFMIGYEIKRYSTKINKWTRACDLRIPGVYYYQRSSWSDEDKHQEVRRLQFQIVNRETCVCIVMMNEYFCSHDYYMTVMQLTPDGSDTLKSEVAFRKVVTKQDARLFPKTVLTAASTNLRIQEVSGNGGRIQELDLSSGTIQEVKSDCKISFPESELRNYRFDYVYDYRRYGNTRQFVTSRQNGCLIHIDNIFPYINVMWSCDPMTNDYKSLPGPPRDEEIFRADIQLIPSELLADLRAYPTAIFEDTSRNDRHGPFYEEGAEEMWDELEDDESTTE